MSGPSWSGGERAKTPLANEQVASGKARGALGRGLHRIDAPGARQGDTRSSRGSGGATFPGRPLPGREPEENRSSPPTRQALPAGTKVNTSVPNAQCLLSLDQGPSCPRQNPACSPRPGPAERSPRTPGRARILRGRQTSGHGQAHRTLTRNDVSFHSEAADDVAGVGRVPAGRPARPPAPPRLVPSARASAAVSARASSSRDSQPARSASRSRIASSRTRRSSSRACATASSAATICSRSQTVAPVTRRSPSA
jgi:hypothetical protein